jgi:hypothetical protein
LLVRRSDGSAGNILDAENDIAVALHFECELRYVDSYAELYRASQYFTNIHRVPLSAAGRLVDQEISLAKQQTDKAGSLTSISIASSTACSLLPPASSLARAMTLLTCSTCVSPAIRLATTAGLLATCQHDIGTRTCWLTHIAERPIMLGEIRAELVEVDMEPRADER